MQPAFPLVISVLITVSTLSASVIGDIQIENSNKSLNNAQQNKFNISTVLDDEWNIGRESDDKDEELPLTVLNIYETLKKNKTVGPYETVRCYFNKARNLHLGQYRFELGNYVNKKSLVDAELHIYTPREYSQNSSYVTFDYLVIRMYQILPTNLSVSEACNNPDLHKLLNVAYMPSFQYGWQVFKVKMAVEAWLSDESNLGVLIAVSDKWENRIYPSFLSSNARGIYRLFLLLYSATSIEAQGTMNKKEETRNTSLSHLACAKREWRVDFKEMGWHKFTIQPKFLYAGRCSGSCATITKEETTLYTYLFKNVFKDESQAKKLCCIPTSFLGTPLMFYDTADNIVIKMYDNLVVNRCECR